MKTVERVGAFSIFIIIMMTTKPCLKKLEENRSAELLASNQFFLNEIKGLITFHSETKDNFQTIEKFKSVIKESCVF